MSKNYKQLQLEAEKIIKLRNPDASKDLKEELMWMYIQGYIASMQDTNDTIRGSTRTSQFDDKPTTWGPYS